MTLRTFILRLLPLFLLILLNTAAADALDDILKRGTIRFGVAEFAPWTMKSKSGELIGFEIDVAKKIAQDMGLKAEFRLYPWDQVIGAVQSGEIDILTGGMSITPSRALKVNFSRPLADSGVGLAANTAMTNSIKTLAGLNNPDIKIAVVNGTLADNVSRTLFDLATIKVYPSALEAAKACVDGEVHAYLASMTQARFLALNNPGKVDLPIRKPLIASKEALAIRKGEQELLNFLNAWVTARQADQWIGTTRDYWFGTLDWAEDVARK